jgi:hypothetical protein
MIKLSLLLRGLPPEAFQRFRSCRTVRIVAQELKFAVGIINPHQYHSKELQRYATFVKRIRQGHLIASQFPATLSDAKGEFSKPAGW